MQNAVVVDFKEYVSLAGDRLVTDSLKVAKAFGKRHADVIRKIELIDCSPEFSLAHFCVDDRMINAGKGAKRLSKMYEMTKDGFMFLVMGFTGKKAAHIKEAFINAFNLMHEFIRSQRGIMQMLAENAAIEKESKQHASAGSRLMLVRKKEKPVILQQRLTLERQLQPSLLLA